MRKKLPKKDSVTFQVIAWNLNTYIIKKTFTIIILLDNHCLSKNPEPVAISFYKAKLIFCFVPVV